jgi:hypothetical protein
MVLVGAVQVDLPEPRDIFSQLLVGKESEGVITLDVVVEDELGPGKKTATPGSATAAKPRVTELTNWDETSLSPTSAGRFATCCRL